MIFLPASMGMFRPAGGGGGGDASLLHLDGTNGSTTITDESGRTWTATGSAQISTAQSKFGGASLRVNRDASTWVDASSDGLFQLGGSTAFTAECWARVDNLSGNHWIWGHGDNLGRHLGLYVNGSSLFYFDGVSNYWNISSIITAETWHHLALCREGGSQNTRLFLDGVQRGTTITTFANVQTTTWRLGAQTNGNNRMSGYIDEFRLVKGTAHYTSNFTPPSGPFTL